MSRICVELDRVVTEFREWRLDHIEFPYVFAERHLRQGPRRRPNGVRAIVVATGVSADGNREILVLAVGDSEDKAFWTRSCARCGPGGWPGCAWSSPMRMKACDPPSRKAVPAVEAMLREAATDVCAFAAFPIAHWKKVWSMNPLERVNKEIKRRQRRGHLLQRSRLAATGRIDPARGP